MSEVASRGWTEAEFFDWLQRQETRFELVSGEPRAMVGATQRHNVIVGGSCWDPGWWAQGWVASLRGLCDGGRGRREPATPRAERPPSWLQRIWSTSRD